MKRTPKSGTMGGTALPPFQRNAERNAERTIASIDAGFPRNGMRNDARIPAPERSTHSPESGTVERVGRGENSLSRAGASDAPDRWTLVLILLGGGRPPLPAHRSSVVHSVVDAECDEPDELDELDGLPSSVEAPRQRQRTGAQP